MSDPHLHLLRCPKTHLALRSMSEVELEALNRAIAAAAVTFEDGTPVATAVEVAFVNEDASFAYIKNGGIYLLLEDSAIALKANFGAALKTPSTNSVMAFYNEKGWRKVGEGVYGDTLFEDLREVATEYVTNCHRRLNRWLTKGRYFFDIASGPVQYAEYLEYSKECEFRVCVDFSIRALEEAQRRLGSDGVYILGDITNLPLKDATMSGGVSLHTIYHVPKVKQRAAFLELNRVLQPGATAVVVYSWGKHCGTMRLVRAFFGIPRAAKRLLARMIYRVARPAKYREILKLKEADEAKAAELYFDPNPFSWIVSELSPAIEWKLASWRFLSVDVMRRHIPNNSFGKGLLRLISRLEDKFPRFAGRYGQYPVILIKKQEGAAPNAPQFKSLR